MEFALTCERDFNLEKILANRPLLFFFTSKPERVVRIDNTAVKISLVQKESKIIVTYDKDLSDEQVQRLQDRIEFCLGLKESMEEFYLLVYHDIVFQPIYQRIHGTRLVSAYDDFEAIVSLICYQNSTYDEYKASVLKLAEHVGKGMFPSPAEILARKSALSKCGLKGKEETIVALAELYQKKGSHVTEEHLVHIPGLGEQTIELFLLHQRRDYSRFYVDSFTKRIIRTYYGTQFEKDIEIKNFIKKKFDRCPGIAIMFLRKLMDEQMSAHY